MKAEPAGGRARLKLGPTWIWAAILASALASSGIAWIHAAQREVQRQAAGGDRIHLHRHILPQLHHGTLAKLFFNLGQCGFQCFGFIELCGFIRCGHSRRWAERSASLRRRLPA